MTILKAFHVKDRHFIKVTDLKIGDQLRGGYRHQSIEAVLLKIHSSKEQSKVRVLNWIDPFTGHKFSWHMSDLNQLVEVWR